MTERVDNSTGQAARHATQGIVVAVKVLRYPTAAVLYAPVPFIVLTGLLAAMADGGARIVGLVVTAAMAAVSVFFGLRRRQIIKAAEHPEQLTSEFAIMVNLTGRADETRGILEQIAGGGGSRVFSRLRGAWRGVTLPARVIDGIDDLPLARHFAPPRVGITATASIAALWLIPISIVISLIAIVGTIAGTFT